MTYEDELFEEDCIEYDFEEEEKLPQRVLKRTNLEKVFLGSLLLNYEDNTEEALGVFEEYPLLRECFTEEDALLFDKIELAYLSNMTRPDLSYEKYAELVGEAAFENNIPLSQLAYFLIRRQTTRKLLSLAYDMSKPVSKDIKIIDKIIRFEEEIHRTSQLLSEKKKVRDF